MRLTFPTITPSGLFSDFVAPVPLWSVISEDMVLMVGGGKGENFRQATPEGSEAPPTSWTLENPMPVDQSKVKGRQGVIVDSDCHEDLRLVYVGAGRTVTETQRCHAPVTVLSSQLLQPLPNKGKVAMAQILWEGLGLSTRQLTHTNLNAG